MLEATKPDRRNAVIATFAVPLVLMLMWVGYAIGWLNTLGYEYRHDKLSGFKGIAGASGSFGVRNFYFFEGQIFFARYEVEVRRGALAIGIFKMIDDPDDRIHFVRRIKDSGRGEVTFRIPESGFYAMYFDGSVLGHKSRPGMDVIYSVHWGVR